MGCGEECQPNQYCDEASNVCSDCFILCTQEGLDARCQDHCSDYLSTRSPTSSTVSGSAVPVYGPKETPQCEACSCAALFVVLSLALLLLVIVILLVVKHYRKDRKDIFNQCKGLFLSRCVSSSSREVDAEAQPLIDHWTEIVTCWRELAKLLDSKDQSQAEDEAVDCTWAQLAEDFKRWAGLFGKHGDRVRYTRHAETGEDMLAGGSSKKPQYAAEFTGERSRHPTITSEPHDKNVKPRSDKQADPSEMPSAQQPSEHPQSPAHRAQEHSGKRGSTGNGTKDEAATPNEAEGKYPKNTTLQPNLTTPQSSPRRSSSVEASDRESSRKQAQNLKPSGTTPHGAGTARNAVGGTTTTNNATRQPPISPPKKVTQSSKSRQQDPGAQRHEGYQQQFTNDPKTASAARPETQGAQSNAGSRRAPVAQTSTTRASQAPDPQTTNPVQCTNGGNADRAANNGRAEEDEEEELNLLSDNSGGAAASAPMGAAAPAREEGLTLSLDLRSDHQETSSMESSVAPSPFDHAIRRLRERSKSIPGVRFRAVTMFKNYLELYVAIDDRSRNIQTVTRIALEIAGLGSSKLLVIEGTPPPIETSDFVVRKPHDVAANTSGRDEVVGITAAGSQSGESESTLAFPTYHLQPPEEPVSLRHSPAALLEAAVDSLSASNGDLNPMPSGQQEEDTNRAIHVAGIPPEDHLSSTRVGSDIPPPSTVNPNTGPSVPQEEDREPVSPRHSPAALPEAAVDSLSASNGDLNPMPPVQQEEDSNGAIHVAGTPPGDHLSSTRVGSDIPPPDTVNPNTRPPVPQEEDRDATLLLFEHERPPADQLSSASASSANPQSH